MFSGSVPLGCAAFLMVHHLTGGCWGFPIRRPLEAGTRTIPLLAILLFPLLLGLGRLYSWAIPTTLPRDPTLQFKHPVPERSFFPDARRDLFRDLAVLAHLLNQWSRRAGRNRRSASWRSDWKNQRAGTDPLWTHDHVLFD